MSRTKKTVMPPPVLPLRSIALNTSGFERPAPMYSVVYTTIDATFHRQNTGEGGGILWITPEQLHELHETIVAKLKVFAAENGKPIPTNQTGM